MHALIICSYYVKYNTKNYVKRLKQVQEKRAPWAQSYSPHREQSYSPIGAPLQLRWCKATAHIGAKLQLRGSNAKEPKGSPLKPLRTHC